MTDTNHKSNEQHPYHAGFVAIFGPSNVGKSTLVNRYLGQKVAAVSHRPQTTRRRQMAIVTLENAQVVFVDLPGLHTPINKLGHRMNQEALRSVEESDLILILVDGSRPPSQEDIQLASAIQSLDDTRPKLLVLNKIDLITQEELNINRSLFANYYPEIDSYPISATRGDNLESLINEITLNLPVGYPIFPHDQITDIYERDISADLIREAALHHLRDEIPYSIAVRIDEFTERGDRGALIRATIFVERESQKPIVIGQGGQMLKQIGIYARKEIEKMSSRKVYLDLRVKVRQNWRNDENALNLFGFSD